MQAVFAKLLYEMEKGHDMVLVTVTRASGSTPRGAGAMMLVGPGGREVGTIGGGGVEMRAEEQALRLLSRKASAEQAFQLHEGGAEDTGMRCGGEITVLFSFVSAQDAQWHAVAAGAMRCFEAGSTAWVVQRAGGGASLLGPQGVLLAGAPCPDAEALSQGGGGRIGGFFSLRLAVGERAVIFGAGHIAQALVPLLRSVGFRPVVFDDRPALAVPERFAAAEKVVLGDYGRIADALPLTEEDYIVVMTNAHTHDLQVEQQVLRERRRYVGVIGSRKKTAAVNARLREMGVSEERIASVHTPVGVPIRAVTPAEIAVSIAAEMILERALSREGETGAGSVAQ